MNLTELETKTKDELVEVAKDLEIAGLGGLRKQDLVFRIMQAKASVLAPLPNSRMACGRMRSTSSRRKSMAATVIAHSPNGRPSRTAAISGREVDG